MKAKNAIIKTMHAQINLNMCVFVCVCMYCEKPNDDIYREKWLDFICFIVRTYVRRCVFVIFVRYSFCCLYIMLCCGCFCCCFDGVVVVVAADIFPPPSSSSFSFIAFTAEFRVRSLALYHYHVVFSVCFHVNVHTICMCESMRISVVDVFV